MRNISFQKLKEVAYVFLKLGGIAFGGPAAHIAMMEDEVVSKRKWMTREHFLDLVGATKCIAAVSIVAVITIKKINAVWIVLGGAILGYGLALV